MKEAILWHPGLPENENEVTVELMDVRGADTLYISYDFERDGYVIKQIPIQVDSERDLAIDLGEPEEVAFIPAWNEVKSG